MSESPSNLQNLPPEPVKQPRDWLDWAIVFLFLVLIGWFAYTQLQPIFGRQATVAIEMDQTEFTAQTGVRVVLVAMTAGGGMIDLRFQISDPDKGTIIHDDKDPVTIIDPDSGIELWRTRHDGAHADEVNIGVTYSHRILNANGIIQQGDLVNLRVGNVILEDIPVQ